MNHLNENTRTRRFRRLLTRRRAAMALLLALPACVVVNGYRWNGGILFPQPTATNVPYRWIDTRTNEPLTKKENVRHVVEGKWGDKTRLDPAEMFFRISSSWLSIRSAPGTEASWAYEDKGTNAQGARVTVLEGICNVFPASHVKPAFGGVDREGRWVSYAGITEFPCRIELSTEPLSGGGSRHRVLASVTGPGASGLLTVSVFASDPDGTITYY